MVLSQDRLRDDDDDDEDDDDDDDDDDDLRVPEKLLYKAILKDSDVFRPK